ncbi:hypothetical protein [Catellatospora citrea]|uniref:Lipoprotein n=1 Tax=Catellatospora citrea TaxID=53366 RepID=A0A8J3P159_9ACTN|nr:hypothetical protein [Catellatospora citrea]RKE09197.1 hypothetical protein C8E86_4078 [Catellatospora citrea]GIF99626.1 hypothetical protein Cci01nite_47200 [Catellatospora citrea]
MKRPLLYLLAAALLAMSAAGCGDGVDAMPLRPGEALTIDADRLVRQLMEIDFKDRTAPDGAAVTCSVRSFGAAPEGASNVGQLTTIWAKTVCGAPGPDGMLGMSMVPVKITLAGQPELFMPRDGAQYGDDLAKLFPDLGVDLAAEWPEFPAMRAELEARASGR